MGKKMGRPRVYENAAGKKGAPSLTVRLSPDIHQHIITRDEGLRAYVERLVNDDIERSKPAELESTKSNDIPGQLLLSDSET